MGVLGNLARRAGIGGTTLATIEELENHPEAIAAGLATGGASVGINALFPGMALNKPGLGVGRALGVVGHTVPSGFGKQVSPHLDTLIHAMEATGRTVEGLQPWHVSGYKTVASGSVIAASADISDMFASAQTLSFSTNDTFPWTFLCKRFRCTIVTEPVDPGTEDGAWQRQLSLRFVVATEVGRISLDAMSVDRIIEAPANGSGGGTANQVFPNSGVPFPVIFEKNGTYQMFLHTDAGLTLTKAMAFSYQMDGWVIQNTSAVSEQNIINSLGTLLGSGTAKQMMTDSD